MKTIIRNFLSILRRYKTATILNILGLSVAFAAFMIIIIQVEFDRKFDRSHNDYDRIFRVESASESETQAILSRPLVNAFIQSSPNIEVGAIVNTQSSFSPLAFSTSENGATNYYREKAASVSSSFAELFTFDMIEGDARALSDPDKVLLPVSLARKLFGDGAAVGKALYLAEGKQYTVGGVYRDLPQNSSIENLVYYPIPDDENINSWGTWTYNLYIRMNDADNVDGLFDNFRKSFDPEANGVSSYFSWENVSFRFRFTPIADLHFTADVTYDSSPKANRKAVLALVVIAFAILIIAGINFANFSAALVPKRIRSINTQKVLGGNVNLIRVALLVEAAGICLASWAVGVLVLHMFSLSPLAGSVDADLSPLLHLNIVGGAAGLSVLLGVIAGAYPSFYLTSFPPALVLKGNFGLSPKGRALRSVLITVQFAASFALIIGAMFMYLQNRYMTTSPLGYDKELMIVADVNKKINEGRNAFINNVKNLAEVDDVTFSHFLLSENDQYMGWGRRYKDGMINYQCLPVTPSFLRVMGIDVVDGRDFREEDGNADNPTAVFNEAARVKYDMKVGDKVDDIEVIGFIKDIKFASFRTEVIPMSFHVWGKKAWYRDDPFEATYAYIKVKAGADMKRAIAKIRSAVDAYRDTYPLEVRFFDSVLQQTYENERKLAGLILLFSLAAIFISIVGVLGLVIFDSEYRRREIAVRKIFGSSTTQILAKFNGNYIRLLLIGFIPAAPLAWHLINLWLMNFAYKTPMHLWVYAAAFLIVSLLTVSAVTYQNWRAAAMNPTENLNSN